ncbi:MAG: DUF5518 domain-containing protein [Candidatus Hodarchaeota archaeon]
MREAMEFTGKVLLGAIVGIAIMIVLGREELLFEGILIGAFVAGIIAGGPGKGALAGILVDLALLAILLISFDKLTEDYEPTGLIEALGVSIAVTILYIFMILLVIILIIPCAILGAIGGIIGKQLYPSKEG